MNVPLDMLVTLKHDACAACNVLLEYYMLHVCYSSAARTICWIVCALNIMIWTPQQA
jgi:hypothetical protein